MSKPPPAHLIRLRGVRHNNLKGFDLDLPLGKLIVVTGLSGSGKSSLAFDTLFAEGQRRYIETFSPYARQFFDRMDKPAVDSIEGIPPAIAIEQRNAVRSTRSTVGTMTEICDHLKVLWPHLATLHCRKCGQPVAKESPQRVWEVISKKCLVISGGTPEALITFDLPLSEKLSLAESLALLAKQGYQRLLVNSAVVRLEDALPLITHHLSLLTVIQDRLKPTAANRSRFIEACEQAYHFGKGRLAVHPLPNRSPDPRPQTLDPIPHSLSPIPFSSRLHCAACDLDYREPSPALFSFNHPVGACPTCKGFGRIIGIDYALALPDHSLTLADGAVKPWRTGTGAESLADMAKFCKKLRVPMNVPFRDLSEAHQRWVMDGDPGYDSNDPTNSWPKKWYGVKGYFRWLESKSYKMHVRVLLSRYRSYTRCPACEGRRLQPEALLYRVAMSGEDRGLKIEDRGHDARSSLSSTLYPLSSILTLADFYSLPVTRALEAITTLHAARFPQSAIGNRQSAIHHALEEVRSRLAYLAEVGLGYLTLDRATRTLSGGETERVNLTTCLGTRLVNTLYVLDEPSVGLHPRDTARLVVILQRLRDLGNTVIVVEHEAAIMRAADQIVDLGPGHGETGGELVFQGTLAELLKHPVSLTGQYLSGRKRAGAGEQVGKCESERAIERRRRSVSLSHSPTFSPALTLTGACAHNLKNLTVTIPLGRFVCLTGVSGSGKSTLVRDCLLPALTTALTATPKPPTPTELGENPGRTTVKSVASAIQSTGLVDKSTHCEANSTGLSYRDGGFSIKSTGFTENPSGSAGELRGSAVKPSVFAVESSGLLGEPGGFSGEPSGYSKQPSGITTKAAGVSEQPTDETDESAANLANPPGSDSEDDAPAGQDSDGIDLSTPASEGMAGAVGSPRVQLTGTEHLSRAVLVDQSALGKTPRSNPAVYIGAFDHLRDLFAASELAKQRGLNASAFSFNSAVGQCDRCRGAGFEKIEMQFLSDIFIKCPACEGRRYRAHILEIKVRSSEFKVPSPAVRTPRPNSKLKTQNSELAWSIADLLAASVDESLAFLAALPDSKPAARAAAALRVLQEVGLGYLRLGQPINTLSGGESQRLKLAAHLAEFGVPASAGNAPEPPEGGTPNQALFIFDEPTTGLHFEDVRVLVTVFQRLVDAGHTVLVIEHNLDVIRAADWLIDLGPEGGEGGGELVIAGTPEQVAACERSHTGRALRDCPNSTL